MMSERLEILKTFKLYINGKFTRTESGRYYIPEPNKKKLANCCLASRKDFRNAVQAARKAQDSWSARPAHNIGQILYRIAENLEGRKQELAELIVKEQGLTTSKAVKEVEEAIDSLIYYAGWSDKYQQLFSSVNPVASSHFNFSAVESMGVTAILCRDDVGFHSFVAAISAAICGGNTIVILASENGPLSAMTFAEIIHHSDVPSGVINILTGKEEELISHFASHMDVNSLLLIGEGFDIANIEDLATENMKRLRHWDHSYLKSERLNSPYSIREFLEVKTTWHPIEQLGGANSSY